MGVQVRGRKSALKLIKARERIQAELEPPFDPDELKIWHEIVNAMPVGYFTPGSEQVLKCLVSHIVIANELIDRIATARKNDADWSLLPLLTEILERKSSIISTLCTTLKLTPRSKYSVERSGNLQALNSTTRPWDIGGER